MTDWVPESRDIPDGLDDDEEAVTYPPPPTKFNTIEQQLNDADRETLRLYANGVAAPGAWRHTEIGDQ